VRLGLEDLMQGEQRAAKLTSQLLMFSRRRAMQKQIIDLNELLHDELKMLRRVLGSHIELTIAAGSANAWVEADSGMIEQVIMNLCINARDAMPGGGTLTLGIQAIEFPTGAALDSLEGREGKYFSLSVADTGCGMSEETQRQIFEPFFTTKEVGKGTGLGLATVYGIVKQHRGWVEVRSELGKGSEFRVLIPASTAPKSSLKTPSKPQIAGGTETVLVVEDQDQVRKMVGECLKANGYKVFESSNGPEALKQWSNESGNIDLLLTDMIMPGGMTGVELGKEFRKLNPDMPVLVMTGYSHEIVTSGISPDQDFKHLSKPCSIVELNNAVREAISGAKANRAKKSPR